MKKRLIACVVLWLLVVYATGQTDATSWFTIKGFLPEWNNAQIQVQINGVPVYNGTVLNDLFSYSGKIIGTTEGLLKITRNKQTTYLPLFIEPGTIKIRDEGRTLAAYGTTTNDTYVSVMHQFDSLALLQTHLRFAAVKEYKRSLAINYIKQAPASPISLKLLADYFYLDGSADDTLYYQLYNSLDTAIRHFHTAKKLEPEVKLRYAVANGRPAPILELPDSTNRLLPIYQPGRITLINFWASWCLPCTREHPALIKLYNQFKEQNFTIVGISLDTNRSAWVNAAKTQQLPWLQLSDLKGWTSPAATLYGVKLIPHNILLDATGTIIGKNLHWEEIETILTKTMGPSPF